MSFLDDLINNIKTFQPTNFEIKNNKSLVFVVFLIIIKKIYGCTLIFDLLLTLFSVIVLIYISKDMDKNNNIMANETTKNYTLLGLITYVIGYTPLINQNTKISSSLSNMVSTIINTITLPPNQNMLSPTS